MSDIPENQDLGTEPGETSEKFEVSGEHLLAKVKELLKEGNVRKIILEHDGHRVMEIPVNVGLAATAVTAAFAPVLVAVGAIAAIMAKVTIIVERDPSPDA